MFSYEMLVNMEHKLPQNFRPPSLCPPDIPFAADISEDKRYMETRAAEHVKRLFCAAHAEGLALYGISGYRSFKRQEILYQNALKKSSAAADALSSFPCEVAPPGCSEHQTGLALDVSCPAVSLNLSTAFGDTPEGKWLVRHAPLYGFILRYPADKTRITKIPWEPWHIRYVTKSLALCLTITGQTLEEYYHITAPSDAP